MTNRERRFYLIFWPGLLSMLLLSAAIHLFDPDYDGLLTQPQSNQRANGEALYIKNGCPSCHGPRGLHPPVESYPKLAGQPEDYLYQQILDIQSGARDNGQSTIMRAASQPLTEAEIRQIALFLSTAG